ncbi:MAG: hypothetical protein WKF42_03450 [Solirubrobacteraceae bacterium]
MTINRLLRRRRRHLAAFAVVLALAGAVAVHHTPFDHMGMGAAMALCLAVLPAVAVAVARVLGALFSGPRSWLALAWAPSRLLVAPPLPRARSSPVATVVLRL